MAFLPFWGLFLCFSLDPICLFPTLAESIRDFSFVTSSSYFFSFYSNCLVSASAFFSVCFNNLLIFYFYCCSSLISFCQIFFWFNKSSSFSNAKLLSILFRIDFFPFWYTPIIFISSLLGNSFSSSFFFLPPYFKRASTFIIFFSLLVPFEDRYPIPLGGTSPFLILTFFNDVYLSILFFFSSRIAFNFSSF